ncbi:MAG: hemerythrin domain-containing protein [Candidatus Xenobia bacterium]
MNPHDDVLAEVVQDHNEIKELFARFDTAAGNARKEACHDLFRKLAIHETTEEIVVHPLCAKAPNGSEVRDDLLAEEKEAEQMLARMEKLDVESTEFQNLYQQLKSAVLAHANHEETVEHPMIRANVPPQRLNRLVGLYQTAEKMAPTHAHPNTPNTAVVRTTIGPIAAIVDRVRDGLRSAMKSDQ